MFYCDHCAEARSWPITMARSLGNCELCGSKKECNSTPSSQLPLPDTKQRSGYPDYTNGTGKPIPANNLGDPYTGLQEFVGIISSPGDTDEITKQYLRVADRSGE